MQSNTLLAVMLFVMQCIDRSFEVSIDTTCCYDDASCIEVVYDHFRVGLFPVLVTLDESPEIDEQISNFFKNRDGDTHMLKVIVGGTTNNAVATCLHPPVRSPEDIKYPFVVGLRDHRILNAVVPGYYPELLDILFYQDFKEFKPNSEDFLYDVYNTVQENPFITNLIREDVKEAIVKRETRVKALPNHESGTSATSSVYGKITGEENINVFAKLEDGEWYNELYND